MHDPHVSRHCFLPDHLGADLVLGHPSLPGRDRILGVNLVQVAFQLAVDIEVFAALVARVGAATVGSLASSSKIEASVTTAAYGTCIAEASHCGLFHRHHLPVLGQLEGVLRDPIILLLLPLLSVLSRLVDDQLEAGVEALRIERTTIHQSKFEHAWA